MAPHPLTNFEIQNCHQNEPKFNGVYSRTRKGLYNYKLYCTLSVFRFYDC